MSKKKQIQILNVYGIEKVIVLTSVQVSVEIALKMKHHNSFVDIFNGFHYENMLFFGIPKNYSNTSRTLQEIII
jgi:hypothetical protein